MARSPHAFAKRQRELAKADKRKKKAERKAARKAAKDAGLDPDLIPLDGVPAPASEGTGDE